ncbi:hypothetical protein FRC20_009173 [Serendipita sp. 405]|nr:hypothetical protein FRC20_009173 [Serendipita sp. 405]
MEWIKNRLLSKPETVHKEGVVGHKGGGGGGGGGGEEQRLATVNGTYPIVVRTRLMSKELLALLDANPRLARNVHTLRLYEAAKDSSDMDYGRFCAEAPRQLPNLRHLVIEGWLYSLLSTTAQKSLGDWCSKVTSITLSNVTFSYFAHLAKLISCCSSCTTLRLQTVRWNMHPALNPPTVPARPLGMRIATLDLDCMNRPPMMQWLMMDPKLGIRELKLRSFDTHDDNYLSQLMVCWGDTLETVSLDLSPLSLAGVESLSLSSCKRLQALEFRNLEYRDPWNRIDTIVSLLKKLPSSQTMRRIVLRFSCYRITSVMESIPHEDLDGLLCGDPFSSLEHVQIVKEVTGVWDSDPSDRTLGRWFPRLAERGVLRGTFGERIPRAPILAS